MSVAVPRERRRNEAEESGVRTIEAKLLKIELQGVEDIRRSREAAAAEGKPRLAIDRRDRRFRAGTKLPSDVAAGRIRHWRTSHHVDHMAVEARVEPEAMLADRNVVCRRRAVASISGIAEVVLPDSTDPDVVALGRF